jgi:hypothetical protein
MMVRPVLSAAVLLLMAHGISYGQTTPQADSSANAPSLGKELNALRDALTQTQQQVSAQQMEIEDLKAQLKSASTGNGKTAAQSIATTAANPGLLLPGADPSELAQTLQSEVEKASMPAAVAPAKHAGNALPPTSIRFGDAILTIGGFVDFENIFRTTNTQSNIATDLGGIPYNNTAQGNVSEFRSTAQYSRVNIKVEDTYRGNKLLGYVEGDFSGNNNPNVYQSVNGLTNRVRLYFGYLQRNKWEFLGGQTIGWLTPNRNGIGPLPSDLAITYNEDQNLGAGIPYTRAAEFRAAYHITKGWAVGAGVEDSNQFIGNYVALPAQFSAIGSQFDNNANAGAANLMPDIIAKTTYDNDFAHRTFHAELSGLFTSAHASVTPVGSTSFRTQTSFGGGGQIAANYELVPGRLLLLGNLFWSDGGAHYLVATGPQLVVRPNAAGTDVRLSMLHAGAGSAGLEWRASRKEAFAVYYGADYFGRNYFPDTTNNSNLGTIIGYGGPGSPNSNNRAIQQPTVDWLMTFWKSDRYGALQYYTQYSYLTRSPWFVAPGEPKNAHLSMVYAGIRYVFPSTSGTLVHVPYPN